MSIIGLDFGTTNTRLSISGSPWRQPGTCDGLMPSAVAFLPNGDVVLGAQAKERLPIDPTNVIMGPKRLLAANFYSHLVSHYNERHAVAVVERHGSVAFSTRGGLKTPEEVCSLIIEDIFARAQVQPDQCALTVTVPVAFDDRQRSSLTAICRHLGFTRVSLLEEPIATAVAYLGRSNVRRAAVFDLGGGTFDFAIIGHADNSQKINVVATGGDDSLGGDDLDLALATWAATKMLSRTGWDLRSEKTVFSQVIAAAEKAKLALWQSEAVDLDLSHVDDASPIDLPKLPINRGLLFDLVLPLIQRTFGICDEVLFNAKLKAQEMDAVFLAGGGTLPHGVAAAVSQYFGKPARADIDPSYVVSIGAGMAMIRPSLQNLLQHYLG